ncbi:YitT family protein [Ihubacter massiliensis]|uniref:YitT family protein n=1 Tax=Hominibacterium faecale TaxID=2839743 RepID=A0A9J6QS00_9FIRM|nr:MULTISPECIES: YitT family protein [Eubacteriales Family XIII. Incertae Sedis]MCC2864671.1 YitT family protein [Anaerovorax odorimutans]MCI7304438.1 YitT family protein [Clostridia bacterium]MDE8733814.1 YitT family protein [Eubacteriales bacterium DFI.9.88]MDY3011113.1 YitT family protein [Clostridiales Family XIII bacterium]MCO7123815.1 YitT family protein [Ihubacter massiliensis]
MKKWISVIGILAGNLILALSVAAFVIPSNLMAGGTTGLALCLEHYFGIPIAVSVAAANVTLFAVGLVCLGRRFAVTTLISTFLYPLLLDLLQKLDVLQHLTDNLLLAAVFAGTLMGLGVGLVLKVGASTGGFDIPPLIFHKKFGIPVSASLYAIDTLIILAQVTFSSPEKVLYGIIVVFLCSATVNKVMVMGSSKVQLMVISKDYQAIRQGLLQKLDCGATLVNIETGFTGEKQLAIMSILTGRKLNEAKKLIQEIDGNAFMVISSVTEVRGRGFTLERQANLLDDHPKE